MTENIDLNFEIPETDSENKTPIDDGLREKLISLAEKGKINYSPKYIQKANRDALEKIKIKYDRKITEVIQNGFEFTRFQTFGHIGKNRLNREFVRIKTRIG